jgi:hypothetical protein
VVAEILNEDARESAAGTRTDGDGDKAVNLERDVVPPRYFFLRRSFAGSVRTSLKIAVTRVHDQSPCLHTTLRNLFIVSG